MATAGAEEEAFMVVVLVAVTSVAEEASVVVVSEAVAALARRAAALEPGAAVAESASAYRATLHLGHVRHIGSLSIMDELANR